MQILVGVSQFVLFSAVNEGKVWQLTSKWALGAFSVITGICRRIDQRMSSLNYIWIEADFVPRYNKKSANKFFGMWKHFHK